MVAQFFRWIETPAERGEIWNIWKKLLEFHFFWVVGAVFFLYIFSLSPEALPGTEGAEDGGSRSRFSERLAAGWGTALFILVFAPLVEEFVFRFIPLACAMTLCKWHQATKWIVYTTACIAAVVFGVVHTTNHVESIGEASWRLVLQTILIQGVAGLIYATIFLKVAAMRILWTPIALFAAYSLHLAWNSLITGPLLLLIGLDHLFGGGTL